MSRSGSQFETGFAVLLVRKTHPGEDGAAAPPATGVRQRTHQTPKGGLRLARPTRHLMQPSPVPGTLFFAHEWMEWLAAALIPRE